MGSSFLCIEWDKRRYILITKTSLLACIKPKFTNLHVVPFPCILTGVYLIQQVQVEVAPTISNITVSATEKNEKV